MCGADLSDIDEKKPEERESKERKRPARIVSRLKHEPSEQITD